MQTLLRLLIAVALLAAHGAQAAPIQWRIEGYTTADFPPTSLLCQADDCAEVMPDIPFVATLTFDSEAPSLEPDPLYGRYVSEGGPYGFVIDIGAHQFSSDIVEITACAIGGCSHVQYQFMIAVRLPLDSDQTLHRVHIFRSYEDESLTSAALPLDPPPLQSTGWVPWPDYIVTASHGSIGLKITDWQRVVPEPRALALLGVALCIIASMTPWGRSRQAR